MDLKKFQQLRSSGVTMFEVQCIDSLVERITLRLKHILSDRKHHHISKIEINPFKRIYVFISPSTIATGEDGAEQINVFLKIHIDVNGSEFILNTDVKLSIQLSRLILVEDVSSTYNLFDYD